MKRITFISPIEAMQGNLSGEQDLTYANGVKAYDCETGTSNAANNYQPRFIGARRAKDGLKYFSVRTKSTNTLTAESKKAMALLGGMGSMVGAIFADKTSQLHLKLVDYYIQIVKGFNGGTSTTVSFRKWVSDFVYQALMVGSVVTIPSAGESDPSFSISNPWGSAGGDYDVEVPSEVLAKFWNQLKANGISFFVNNLQGIAITGETWATMIANSSENILGAAVSGDNVKIGDEYVLTATGAAVLKTDTIAANAKYRLSAELPA